VLNAAAARLIYRKSRCEHVTPFLRELHWLRSERVDYKLAVDHLPLLTRASATLRRVVVPALVIVGSTDCQTNATGNHGRPCLSGRRQSTIEHSAARRHLSAAPTLPVFCNRLKSHLFKLFFTFN